MKHRKKFDMTIKQEIPIHLNIAFRFKSETSSCGNGGSRFSNIIYDVTCVDCLKQEIIKCTARIAACKTILKNTEKL